MAPQYRTVTSRKAALILAEVALFLPQRVEKYTASAFHLNSLEKMPASRKSLSVLFLLSCRLKALSFSITKQSSKKIVRDKKNLRCGKENSFFAAVHLHDHGCNNHQSSSAARPESLNLSAITFPRGSPLTPQRFPFFEEAYIPMNKLVPREHWQAVMYMLLLLYQQ